MLYFVHAMIFDSFVTMNIASLGNKINFCWAAAIARPIFKEKSSAGLSVKKVRFMTVFVFTCSVTCINS